MSMTTDVGQMMLDSASRILSDLGPEARETGNPEKLWQAFDAAGFAHALVPEASGGLGLGWAEAGELFREIGRHAVPCPLVETMLAARLLADADCRPPSGILTLTDTSMGDVSALDGRHGHGCLGAVALGMWWHRVRCLMGMGWHCCPWTWCRLRRSTST